MAWSARPTSTFGARPAYGTTGTAAGAGGFNRTGGGFGQTNTQSFAQPAANRFGAGAGAPTGFGANRPTTGFGAGGGGGGGFGQQQQQQGGFGQQQQQQQQGNGVPNYQPTATTDTVTQGNSQVTVKCELRAITAMDFYKDYSFEQLRWLNLSDPSTQPAQQTAGMGGGFGFNRTGAGTGATTGGGGFGQQRTGGFGSTAGAATGVGTGAGGFGQRAAGAGGFGQGQQQTGGGGFGQQRTGGFGAGAAATGTTGGGFGQRPAGTTSFGAKPAGTGFGQQAATGGGFGQRPAGGFGSTAGQQQPVFQQGAAAGGGFGAKPTGFGAGAGTSFGNNSLRVATGVQRDGTTGMGGGFGARPQGGFGGQTAGVYGQQQTAMGQQPAGGFGAGTAYGRPMGYGQQQAAQEPVYYTTISSAPFGILPQMLKDTAAAPKVPSSDSKATSASTPVPTSASKRKHTMLPHYKLTPRSELASAPSRLSSSEASESAGRDMFVSKLGGVKKLVIEASDSEQSALFNPTERARLRQGIATGSISGVSPSVPGTPSATLVSPALTSTSSMLFSPGVFATPSYPRTASYGDASAIYAGYPVLPSTPGAPALYTSPTASSSSLAGMVPPVAQTNPHTPTLTIPACYTVPSINELSQKSPAELARLPEFTIGHHKYGTVSWKTPTDVRALNLDKLVSFSQDSVEVYPEAYYPHGSPADGVLNKTATVTIFNVSVWKLIGKEPISSPDRASPASSPNGIKRAMTPHEVDLVISELRRQTELFHGRFISFSPEGNKWVFEVDHFTRYGLGGSNAVQPSSTAHTANNTAQSSPAHSPSQGKLFGSRNASRPIASSRMDQDLDYDDDTEEDEELEEVSGEESSDEVRPLLAPVEDSFEEAASARGSEAFADHDEDDDFGEVTGDEDEEDEEEEYGEEEDHNDDSRSDFSRSDSVSTFAQRRRKLQRRRSDEGGSVKSGLSRRGSSNLASNDPRYASKTSSSLSSHSAASSAQQHIRDRSATDRNGAESRTLHLQQQQQQQPRSSPFLAKQLGLNARDMQQMKSTLFAEEPKFQSTKRTDSTQWDWDYQHAAKRFKGNATSGMRTEPVSEVKMQMPRAFARFPIAKPSLAQHDYSSKSAPQHMEPIPIKSAASIASTALKFVPVPLANSITKDASEVSIDPMLYQGRSMRVCWTPQGTLYCPTFTTVKHCKVHTASTSVNAALLPSLQAHQKLSQLSYERTSTESASRSEVSAHQTCKSQGALPYLHISENWNAFVNQQVVIVSSHLEEVTRALGASSGSNSGEPSRWSSASHQSVLLEAYYKFKSELAVWKMFRALFGEPKHSDAISRFEGTSAEDHVTRLVRKHQLDQLLCELTLDDVKRELLELSSSSDISSSVERHWKVLFTLLTGKRIEEAVELALSMGENRLALLLTQAADPTTLHADVRKQLQTWTKEGAIAAAHLEPYKLALFSVLAGEVRVVASESRIRDWLRSFAMFFWYSGPNSFAQPLETTIDLYSALSVTSGTPSSALSLAPPSPAYARAFPSLAHQNQHDVLFHMLRLYGDRWCALDAALHPLANSPRILDFSLSWFLLSVCRAAHVGSVPHRAGEISVAFATQLEMAGMWTWSVYVLLALPASHEALRNHAVREVLFKYAEALEASGIVSTATHTIKDEAVSELFHLHTQHIKIPTQWLYEALAQLYQYRGDWMNEVWARLKAEQWEMAHDILISRWATKVIVDFGADASTWPIKFINALQILETHASVNRMITGSSQNSTDLGEISSGSTEISNWVYGGNIFLTYHRWYNAVKNAQVAWQSSVESVDNQQLAQLNRDASDFISLVNEWTGSLEIIVSILQERESSHNSRRGGVAAKENWASLSSSPAGLSLRQRRSLDLGNLPLLKQQLFCAAELSSQLLSSIASLKLLIACIDSDAALPSQISQHLVPLPSYEMLDSIEPLEQAFIAPDQLTSNLALLTSRYLDWRVSAM